jgi:hypothetical protein
VPWYYRVRDAINTAAPFLVPTQTANLALLVSAIFKKQSLCLSELARAYPISFAAATSRSRPIRGVNWAGRLVSGAGSTGGLRTSTDAASERAASRTSPPLRSIGFVEQSNIL